MSECIFCKIIAGTVSASVVAEDDDVIVIKDRAPKAPVHLLLIPKKHIQDIQSFSPEDLALASKLFGMAQQLSQKIGKLSSDGDFRLLINSGKKAGQCVFHLHAHFLAGESIPPF